jgi:hypothetical protein
VRRGGKWEVGGGERENVEGQETDFQASSVRDVNMGIENNIQTEDGIRKWGEAVAGG